MVFAFEDRQDLADVVQRRKKTLAGIQRLGVETTLRRGLLRSLAADHGAALR
jgi:hypothetical protein